MSLWEAEEASLWLAAHVITTAPQRHTTMMMSLLLLPRRRTVELFWIEWWLKRNRWISVVNEVLFEIQLLFHAAVVVDQMWFVNSVCGCLRAGPPTTNDSEDAAKYWIVSLSEVLKTNFRWDDLVSVPGKLNWVGIVHLFSKSFFRLRSSKEGSYLHNLMKMLHVITNKWIRKKIRAGISLRKLSKIQLYDSPIQ